MTTSPNGAPILHGDGLQSVKECIEAEFQKSRRAGTTSSVPWKPKVERILGGATAPAPPPLRPLHEIAEVYVRVAGRQVSGTPVLHPRHEGAYFIQPPCESASVLMEQAVIAIQQIPTRKAEERHEVKDLWGDGE